MPTHQIATEPIPDKLLLRPGLVKICIARIDDDTGEVVKFLLPVQWTPQEAADLIHEIRGLVWQIAEDGLPGDYEGIKEVCNAYVHQKVGYVEPPHIKWRREIAAARKQ